ncbi:hypothetical protein GUJ93_ZPchr0011g27404 [Zizania palustris]|uniref:Uncharacterized protein n=1 Tax=Zizania palustris TaxID=103762 RepID=A0A8J5WL84_ZIZPA|nr:hypothetical protein GUJ93_ZPchr0011g27404 [Zizania palustris]
MGRRPGAARYSSKRSAERSRRFRNLVFSRGTTRRRAPAAGRQSAKRCQDNAGVAEVFEEMPPQLIDILFLQMRCPSNPEFPIRTSSWIQPSSSNVAAWVYILQ